MTPAPIPIPSRPGPEGNEPLALVDMAVVKEYLHFARGSVSRHWLRSLAVFILVVACAGVSVWALPRTYHVESKVLAQPNQVMTALDNPGRAVPNDADAPTRAASETVLQRTNLISLVHQTNLLDRWAATRAPAVRLKDAILAKLAGAPTEDDRLDSMVGLLQKRLKVTAAEHDITIEIDWPDAQQAYQLVETAEQNFLETRHAMEVSAIAESISILESHVATARANMEQATDDMHATRQEQLQARTPASTLLASDVAAHPAYRRSRPVASAAAAPDPEVEQLRAQIVAKHEAIHDLEEFRRRRVVELQGQLTEALATYAPAHPAVLTIRTTMEQMQHDSPQLSTLRQEEQQLVAEFIHKGGRDPDVPASMAPSAPPRPEGTMEVRRSRKPLPEVLPTAASISASAAALSDAPSTEDLNMDEDRVRMASLKYDDLLSRLEAARIELDTARAAFKYRYSVVTPPAVPKKATKPNLALTAVAGLLSGFLLAIAVAVLADVRTGRLMERWQVQRELGIPVLAEVDRL